jgi:hypothetical protein
MLGIGGALATFFGLGFHIFRKRWFYLLIRVVRIRSAIW